MSANEPSGEELEAVGPLVDEFLKTYAEPPVIDLAITLDYFAAWLVATGRMPAAALSTEPK
ncbi:unnamed protein product [Gemmata massiliana]|uniref:Uncharacterized protein n=1 Tax=Gemmata massiliana TaxID=1210884 RepID=A0A6P2DL47_9BACT|nr:hypothetical protein [Gemmata massiliana]VTS03797.1 unnamed protein product [Gemmata massiliana]